MMDLPTIDSNDSQNHGQNVCCHRISNDARIECVKKLVQYKNGQNKIANPFPSSTSKSARNRTTATALLLYFSYTLSIHLLWTNCVIFTLCEPAQLKLNVNPSWNLLHHQRTESNRSLNSNNSHNNLKSNLGDVSSLSHSSSPKLNGVAIKNNSSNSKKNDNGRAADANQFDFLTNFPEFSANRELDSTASLQAIDVNHTTRANEAVSPMPMPIRVGMRMGMRDKHFHTINRLKRLKRTTSLVTRRWHIAHRLFSKRNEFRRRINVDDDDEIRFKRYQSESENVIKSAKNHAIKRNVNTFTTEALGDNSNLSIINTVFPKPKPIKPSSQRLNGLITTTTTTTTMTTTTTSAPTSIFDAKSILNGSDGSDGSGSDKTTDLVTSAVPTAFRQNQPNQTVNGDRKLKANNSTTINRMENNRNNNSRITSYSNVTASKTASTTTTTTVATTVNPITRKFSSGSTPPGRFRVNDVFEMDTKQKYYNYSGSGGDGSSYRRNKDNQVTSFENDEQNKWHVQHRNGKRIISLLGLFELSTRNGLRVEGLSELAAAELAVKHINKRERLLPGYTLQLITNDTKCDPGVGVDRFFHAVYTKRMTRVQMLLGSACSEVTESLAKVVPHWNIVQVSFGSTSPALSDRTEFPLFYRTVAPDSSHNPARIAFIRRFGWDTVTTFSQNEEIHSLAVNDLVTELENANISCAATITFAETDFKNQLKMLRDLDTRIIIGSFSHDLAPKIFCEAYKLGMFGADYVWILHEIVGEPWWHKTTHECSQKQLQEVSENLLIVSSHNSIVSNEISYSGLTYSMFVDELNSQLNESQPAPLSRYAAQTYDAVWAIALSLNGAETKWKQLKSNSSARLQLDHFDYTRYDMALEFFHQFSRLKFLGVSGPVSFSGADRIGISVFSQVQDGRLQSVALFHPSKLHLDFDCLKCVPIKWKNGQVPIAKRVFKLRVATVSPVAFFIVSTLALIGIILSISFLAFNLHFRKLKAIKLSSPKLSNITAFGCILVYAAVILLGLDHSTLPATEKAFPVVCTARVYLLSSGFSLAFGSMFAKTYRVHRIFTRSGSSVCKDRMLRDAQLISLVCALLLLDGLVLGFWVVFDPMERHLSNLTLEISLSDRSVVYQPQVEVCRSQSGHTQSWLGALYIYKGLLLVVGVYMAWETRHVKIPALNDSQYIGVSVYSVVITSAIVVVLANLISERVTLAFVTITALILTSTTATLCLLFLPKMHDIWAKGVINDPVIHSMGLKMECNTRRFMIDDKRELQYRVEVQNRVYKKELAALDIEIGKLEKLLETPSSTSSSDLSIPRLIKHELAVVNEENEKSSTSKQQRAPSIGGGLPLLLLSVLPPVIPRASWPSADMGNNMMRKSVTFSSQPQLEDESCVARLPAIDLLHLRLTHQQATADARKGLIDRIIGGSSGIAAALKVHMGLFSNIVPAASSASSCNAIDRAGMYPLRKMSIARSGNAINTRCSSITYDPPFRERSINLPPPPPFIISTESDSTNTSRKNIYVDTEHEPKVNFYLPLGRRASILNQPTLRERVKGSPRFPHRIAPTSSLNALVESTEASGASSSSSKSKWKSMEDSTMFASSSTSFNTSNC